MRTLSLQWIHSLRGFDNEMTPLVLDGIMYITGPNQASALDAASGREIWRFSRPRTPGLRGDAARGFNRGVAVLGSRVFFVTDNAHLVALSRVNGALLWEVVMPEKPEPPYGGTMAPLVVGDLVIAGVSGGDEGIRGFIAAYHASTGAQAWRFWTVPARGEPAAESWPGDVNLDEGGGATWLTGAYDPETGTLYWPTGNPYPDTDGSQREGDNLYTNSMLALDAKTGKLRWYFQFTPHDLWDWDAQEPPVLVDATFQGTPRKLLLQANRNGFFYVLDRTNGTLLLAKPFVQKLTWASGIGPDGRPQLAAWQRSDARRRPDVPGDSRRHQLDVDGVQSGDASFLRDGRGELLPLSQHDVRWRPRWAHRTSRGLAAAAAGACSRRRRAGHRRARRTSRPAGDVRVARRWLQSRRARWRRIDGVARARHRDRTRRVGGAADRQLQQLRRHAIDRRRHRVLRPGRAESSPRSTRRPAPICGTSKRRRRGSRRR